MPGPWTRASLAWVGILALAILNGAVREGLLVPRLGRTPGLVASGLLLSALVLLVAFATLRWIAPATRAQAWAVGALWLALTLGFEFGFGALVKHKPLHELLAAYRFADGNLWPLVLLVVLVAPALAQRLRA